MKNILHDDITEAEIAEALAWPRPALLPALGSKEWEDVAANPVAQTMLAPLRIVATREIDEMLPVLTNALYADYYATGQRLPFENLYFERRRRAGRAAICALVAPPVERDKWVDSFIRKLTDIFEEDSWSLPAHVGLENPTGKDALMIDLFCAETANLMGEAVTIFGNVLPDSLITKIKARLNDDIFQNYLDTHERIVWVLITYNWNGVCHQGILGAALALAEVDVCARMLKIASGYLPAFLSGYGADGGSQEGPSYWTYGFGWFSVLNEQLETASRGALSVFERDEHIRQIALYAPRTALSHGNALNFSDCVPRIRFNPCLLRYLGNRLEEPTLHDLACDEYSSLIDQGIDANVQKRDLFYLARLFLDLPQSKPDAIAMPPRQHYFANMQVVVSRTVDRKGHLWEFAAKGGHNGEHHNHNDCGTYLLNIDGERLITEIGAPEYTREFFSPKRYENLAARTFGHSLPIVSGHEQVAGGDHAAQVTACDLTSTLVRFELDLTSCYPAEANCVKLIRRFDLDTLAGKLLVNDKYELGEMGTFETAIISVADVTLVANGAVIRSKDVTVTLSADDSIQFDEIETHSYSDHDGALKFVKRLVLRPKFAQVAGEINYAMQLCGQ